jgi:hypothetical protein
MQNKRKKKLHLLCPGSGVRAWGGHILYTDIHFYIWHRSLISLDCLFLIEPSIMRKLTLLQNIITKNTSPLYIQYMINCMGLYRGDLVIVNVLVLPLTAVEIKRTKNNLAISCSSIVKIIKIVDILFLIASKYGFK